MSLARTVLEEQWNEQAQALMELGGKLWTAQGMLGGEHLSLMKLVLPKEGEDFQSWNWRALADRSGQYSTKQRLINTPECCNDQERRKLIQYSRSHPSRSFNLKARTTHSTIYRDNYLTRALSLFRPNLCNYTCNHLFTIER